MSETGRSVLLAIGGGIASYKAAFLCSRLVQCGYDVRVAMTRSAKEFIGAATLSALSGKAVGETLFEEGRHPLGAHIELAMDLDLMVVAPATANLMAKFANGVADDLVSTLYLQVEAPILIAPAMSAAMWNKRSVQRNVCQLRDDGCHLVGPESGWLSCRKSGEGRMSEPDQILAVAEELLNR